MYYVQKSLFEKENKCNLIDFIIKNLSSSCLNLRESHSRKLLVRCPDKSYSKPMNGILQDLQACRMARINRDRNFDGKFFFAVKTTGIFCRPSCPSPAAREENVVYCGSIFQAIEMGFRPCRRCRPDVNLEYHNSYIPGSRIVQEALALIYDGFLNYCSIADLAERLSVSDRHLRTLFIETIGIPPVKVGRYHKAVFARKLLGNSAQSVTDIAMASGYRTIRQFNSSYKAIFGENPRQTRRDFSMTPVKNLSGNTPFLLPYDKSFDFDQILSFMKPRLIPGVELVLDDVYYRTFRTGFTRGWFSVGNRPEKSALELNIRCGDIRCYMEVYYRVRNMFDLDTDFSLINQMLGGDLRLARGMKNGAVPRLPAAFDPFEFTIRAILGQQITVKAATTLAGRIAARTGIPCGEAGPAGLDFYFPTAEEMSSTDLSDCGITAIRQETIRRVTAAVREGAVDLSSAQNFNSFYKAFTAVRGIGDWTVNYVAMRGLGMRDAFPASDLGIIKALSRGEEKAGVRDIMEMAEKWRPYRAYAALCLWNSLQEDL